MTKTLELEGYGALYELALKVRLELKIRRIGQN